MFILVFLFMLNLSTNAQEFEKYQIFTSKSIDIDTTNIIQSNEIYFGIAENFYKKQKENYTLSDNEILTDKIEDSNTVIENEIEASLNVIYKSKINSTYLLIEDITNKKGEKTRIFKYFILDNKHSLSIDEIKKIMTEE